MAMPSGRQRVYNVGRYVVGNRNLRLETAPGNFIPKRYAIEYTQQPRRVLNITACWTALLAPVLVIIHMEHNY